MSAGVTFRPFLAGDIVQLALQPSQHVTLGFARQFHSIEDGRELEETSPTAWTAQAESGRILACAGLKLLWPASPDLPAHPHQPRPGQTHGHAIAWAMLAADLGPAHVAITRFFKKIVAEDPCTRIEAIVRADVAAECRWAELVGFELGAVLRAWGPEGKVHLLFERIRPAPGEPELDGPRRLEPITASASRFTSEPLQGRH